jgi:hypothetical protein
LPALSYTTCLHDAVQITVDSSKGMWSKVCQYAVAVLQKLGEALSGGKFVKAISEHLLHEVCTETNAKRKATKAENKRANCLESIMDIACKNLARGNEGSKVCCSLLLIGTWCKSKLVFQKKSICNMAKRPGRRQGVKTTISSFGSTNNDDNDELDSDEAFKQLR